MLQLCFFSSFIYFNFFLYYIYFQLQDEAWKLKRILEYRQGVIDKVKMFYNNFKDVFDKSLNVTQVAGWSDKIFDIVANSSKGYEAIIKEIEKNQE